MDIFIGYEKLKPCHVRHLDVTLLVNFAVVVLCSQLLLSEINFQKIQKINGKSFAHKHVQCSNNTPQKAQLNKCSNEKLWKTVSVDVSVFAYPLHVGIPVRISRDSRHHKISGSMRLLWENLIGEERKYQCYFVNINKRWFSTVDNNNTKYRETDTCRHVV